MYIPLPSTESLQHRAEIAKRLSSLRHVLPRVPFWKLAAHRIPTLWTLYRGLLRHVQHDNVRVDVMHGATTHESASRSDITSGRYSATTDTPRPRTLPRSSWNMDTKYM